MAVRIYLGHGASGSAATMAPFVDGLGRRGIEAHPLQLPRRRAEDAVAALLDQVPDEPGVVVGGHSFGGRVASLAAAGGTRRFAGLVCFSYPLHRPGAPEMEVRSAHWPGIACPAFLLSGESDPFARIDLLRAAALPCRPRRSSRTRDSATRCGRCSTSARPGDGLRRLARGPDRRPAERQRHRHPPAALQASRSFIRALDSQDGARVDRTADHDSA
jgi:pimeloyl-ACP methyl ester carboxylesterase